MQYNRNETLRRFRFLSHRQTLAADLLVARHSRQCVMRIVSDVIDLLEARRENLEYWRDFRDRRWSLYEYLTVQQAIRLERGFLVNIMDGRIDAGRIRSNFTNRTQGIAA